MCWSNIKFKKFQEVCMAIHPPRKGNVGWEVPEVTEPFQAPEVGRPTQTLKQNETVRPRSRRELQQDSATKLPMQQMMNDHPVTCLRSFDGDGPFQVVLKQVPFAFFSGPDMSGLSCVNPLLAMKCFAYTQEATTEHNCV